MKNYAKKISMLLALILTLTGFQGLFSLSVFADEPTAAASDEEEEEELPDYTKIQFATGQAKLDDIRSKLAYDEEGNYLGGNNLFTRRGDYYLYVDGFSGEVIWRNQKTGEMLFSNPYDVAYPETARTNSVKQEMLSQIILTYSDSVSEPTMNSYRDACQNQQISLKYITNGIRVNYSIGEEEARKLVPRMIEKSRFESMILDLIPEGRDRELILTYYTLLDQSDENLTSAQITHLKQNYPITNTMAVYVFDSDAQKRELTNVEGIISRYTEYTFDDLNEDHSMVGYEGNDAAPPVFKMGLEYTLAEDGSLQVRLASSGIRYDEDNYQLKSISILPYFGATSNKYQGYTFLPDGSGTLIENSDNAYTLAGQIYGRDFAYHQISGANQETIRMPVFGVVQHTDPVVQEEESDVEQTDEPVAEPTDDDEPTDDSDEPEDADAADEDEPEEEDTTSVPAGTVLKPDSAYGYFAIIEEGAPLATITSTHGGAVYKYSSVYTRFSPRASDTYNLKGSLSVDGNTMYTVNSKRKYTGNYALRFYMLTDDALASRANLSKDEYYEVSYMGMAKAYQDYLVQKEGLTPLTKEDTASDIPLYIESFGALDTDGTFLSFPVTVKRALTTFDDLKTMYAALEEEGITNVNFKLTGFTNGGMRPTSPYHVKFVDKVGGNSGFKDFVSYAAEKNIGVYPDFDFSYVAKTGWFDGFDMKKQAIKTIDSRYTQKREYSAIYQTFEDTGLIGVSPSAMKDVYENFTKEYAKLGATALSVGTLGSDLNSDFNRKNPHDRADAQMQVENLLTQVQEDYSSIMLDGGNAYTLKYADHILNMPLESSRYAKSSQSIPFMSLVLHGYVQYAGSPTNMASDSRYEMLKMIETGANPYFILSYQNLSYLKEDKTLNKYYSVSFDIWKDDLIETYTTMNDLFGDLQTERIVNHEFLSGVRVHTAEESAAASSEKQFETDAGTIVRVTYSNGARFYINYNNFDVTTEDGAVISADSYVRR
ncbi:MAG: hypothetical protein HFE78_04395 [Clostridiales bacterium]|nr:hypothetical protein [Clostridiales bacterium]